MAEETEKLNDNDLVGWFQYGLPLFLKKYGSYLLLGAALCLLGYQIYNYYQRKQQVELQNAWTELQLAAAPGTDRAPDKLDAIIHQYASRDVQSQAYLAIADFYLLSVAAGNPPEGYQGVKVSQKDALDRAEAAAKVVASNYPDQTLAVGKAQFQLATAAMDRRDWDAAKKQLEQLADKSGPYAGTGIASAAQSQLDHFDMLKDAPEIALPPPTTAPTTSPSSSFLTAPQISGPTSRP